jgi:hypothetical protein
LSTKDKIKELWQNRFKHGFNFTGFTGNFNVYHNGAVTAGIGLCIIESAGTGHWPFALFKVSVVTGERRSWQVMLCGLCFGEHWVHDVDNLNLIVGPDKREFYWLISAINHQSKVLEEII